MKVWEVMRRAEVVVTPSALLRQVKDLFRRTGERIAPVVEEALGEEKVVGFVTHAESVLPTSRKSEARVRDALREHPLIEENMEVEEAYRLLREHGVQGAPVVKSIQEPVLRGVITLRDIIRAMLDSGYTPIAESVAEVMTTEDLDRYLVEPGESITKAWSRLVYRGIPGLIVIRSRDDPVPIGMLTLRNFVETDRWLFHRESERGVKTPAKVRRIMTRGVVAATPDTPIEYVARFMSRNDIELLPVVDKEGRVVGVVTQEDVARAYIEGRKVGRRPVPLRGIPRPLTAEERIRYVARDVVLEQISVAKPVTTKTAGIRVSDILLEDIPAISINDTVEHARREMLRKRTNYLVVVDEAGRIVGAVTKWTMLRAIGLKGPLWRRRVNDKMFIDYVMETRIPEVRIDESIEEAALKLVENGAELAIVVDEEGAVRGFVTKDQIVRAYAEKMKGRALVENVMTPGRLGVVHPHHSLYHAVNKMKTLYLDALTVYDGSRVRGVISANRLPFVAYEDAVTGPRSRRLIWVRKLVRGAERRGRYVKVTPLLAMDVMVRVEDYVKPGDDAARAVELMEKNKVDGVPVVDEEGRVLGVVCKNDILRELARTAKKMLEERAVQKIREQR